VKDLEETLSLSLISHTNTGKTTLARTLLRRDVGEVFDQAHTTDENERFAMLELDAVDPGRPGGRVVLWDTPGFGDSARLLRELEGRERPLDWLEQQTWDRFEHRALWSSQQAIKNVRHEADVVLYLVNASEDPAMAGYVEPEMKILGWIGRPVIVVLNQTGPPGDAESRRRAEERWRWHLASHAAVQDVISLDAFSRCWIQEGLLFLRLHALVPERHAAIVAALLERWREDQLQILEASVTQLSKLLSTAAADGEPIAEQALLGRLARKRASESLARRLDQATREAIDALIELHQLEGEAASWARGQLQDISVPGDRPNPTKASVLGGIVGGGLGGLAADLSHAGLTFGGGTVVGAILGALGLGGLAWGYEQLTHGTEPKVVWATEFLDRLARDALLRYLAVAHFGRGGGAFRERARPELWQATVERELGKRSQALASGWAKARGAGSDAAADHLRSVIDTCVREILIELYPGAERFLHTYLDRT
jgi:hypothetical protein